MSTRYVKTEAGRQAIRDRQQGLSRPARNLLLIIDGQRPGAEWVTLVQGSSEADLAQLIDGGLIEAVGGSAAAPAAVPTAVAPAAASAPTAPAASTAPPSLPPAAATLPPAEPAPDPAEPAAGKPAKGMTALMPEDDTRPIAERLQEVGYRHLYDTMTSQARPLLGLIKGYRMVLDVEKCNGPDELRKLALRFVDEVRAAQGVGAAYRITEALCRPPEA